jgi:hypothetical protein
MLYSVLAQLQIRSAAVQRSDFRRGNDDFVFATGHGHLLLFREQRHGVVLSLNLNIP